MHELLKFYRLRFGRQLIRLHPIFLRDAEHVFRRQQERFRKLIEYAARHSPYYERKFAGINLETWALTDLPILTKREMMENFEDVLTTRTVSRDEIQRFIEEPSNLGKLFKGNYAVAHTSGSQGRPALIVQDGRAMALAFAMQVVRGSSVSRTIAPKSNRLFSPVRLAIVTQRPGFYPSGFFFSYLPPGLKPFLKVKRLSVFDPVDQTVADLNEFKPNVITGYTSALELLAHEETAGRLRLREADTLEQIVNISEPLPQLSRNDIENAFAVPVSDRYMMGECLALSSGCSGQPGSHVNADWAILEVVDEAYRPVPPGQRGAKVLVTNLYNFVQPFIRYEVDDAVTMSPTSCPCQSILPHISSIEGRSKDRLWIEREGRYEELPYYLFLAALHNELDMAEHQIVQTGVNAYTLRAMPLPGRSLSPDRLRRLVFQSVESEGLEKYIHLDIEIVKEIERGPTGKAIRVKNVFGPPSDLAAAASAEMARLVRRPRSAA
jgi:phenylacetate-CoA ligase